MNTKLFDTVTALIVIILIPMVGASTWAFIDGQIKLAELADMWLPPLALLFGFYKGKQQDSGK